MCDFFFSSSSKSFFPIFLKVYGMCPLASQLEPESLRWPWAHNILPKLPSSSLELQLSIQHEHCSQRSIFWYVNLVLCLLFKTHFSLGLMKNILSFLEDHRGLSPSFQGSQNRNLRCHQREGPLKCYSCSNWHDSTYHGEPLACLLGMLGKDFLQGKRFALSTQKVLNRKMVL